MTRDLLPASRVRTDGNREGAVAPAGGSAWLMERRIGHGAKRHCAFTHRGGTSKKPFCVKLSTILKEALAPSRFGRRAGVRERALSNRILDFTIFFFGCTRR